jgi:hypothetical protein
VIHEPKKNETAGITEKLKEIAKLSLDRLPVLNSIFEDMSVTCVERFRDYCSPAFTAFVNQVASGDSWDLLEARADSIAVIFYCVNGMPEFCWDWSAGLYSRS